jgi:hypothetical protein
MTGNDDVQRAREHLAALAASMTCSACGRAAQLVEFTGPIGWAVEHGGHRDGCPEAVPEDLIEFEISLDDDPTP